MASRGIDPAIVAQARAGAFRRMYFLAMEFTSGPVLVHSWAFFSYYWDYDGDGADEEFKGVGRLGAISPIKEGTDLTSNTVSAMLAGIPQDQLAEVYDWRSYRGRKAQIFEGWLDDGYRLVATPRRIFRGIMDAAAVEFGDGISTIELPLHSRMIRWKDAPDELYTNADQQNRYPGDKGLEFVQRMAAGAEVPWGVG